MAIKPRSDAGNQPADVNTFQIDLSGRRPSEEERLTKTDVRNPSGPFVFFIGHGDYQLIDGRFLPRLHKILIRPGVGHIGPKGELHTMIRQQEEWGRRPVPTDIIVEAFGEEVKGYCRAHKRIGSKHAHHTTVWESFEKIGGKPKWKRDKDGYVKFLELCHGLLYPEDSNLNSAVIDDALRGIRAELDYLDTRPPYDQKAQRRKTYLISLLPANMRPGADETETEAPNKGKNTNKGGKR